MNKSGVILHRKNQKYFLLNINEDENTKKKNKVFKWIHEKKFAPIFYGKWTIEQIKNNEDKLKKRQHDEAKSFLDTFTNISDENIVISIGEKNIFFFNQADELKERPYEIKDVIVKGFNITPIISKPIQECPLVLANIKANRYLSSGTFIPLNLNEKNELDEKKYFGNVKAIEYLLNFDKAPIYLENFTEYLKCLSSVEFETLIAKILEEQGFFVPAYRGGCIKNFDLLCRNSKETPIKIGENKIEKKETKSIQIKLTLKEKDYKQNGADFYFCIELENNDKKENVFDANDIKKLLDNSKTLIWLKESLNWAIVKS